jgi:hypothetical protein
MVLGRGIAEGLGGGEGFATYAGIVKTDAQRQRAMPGIQANDWGNAEEASLPVRQYLAALNAANAPAAPSKSISLTDPAVPLWTCLNRKTRVLTGRNAGFWTVLNCLKLILAEEVRFELTEGITLRWFSRPVP